MKCKKCGCDTLIKKDDWYTCANCGNVIFDTDINIDNKPSPTKIIDEIENGTYKPEKRKATGTGKNNKKTENKKSKIRELTEFFIPIIAAIIIAILLKTLVFANARVPTGSMLNTIHEGDRIFASRLAYINNDPERYDIVIFKYPDDESQYYVKRVIGLPKETVQIIDGTVFVTKADGNTIQLDDEFVTNCIPQGDYGPYKVPDGSYFMMGDNRNSSWDSRFWDNKFVKKNKIIGKVKFKYYPETGKIE